MGKRGFTLIELLAVIVILGILMIVAIPQITKYIENSRKDTYMDTAKAYINAARFQLLNDDLGEYRLPEDKGNITFPLSEVKLEQGGKSGYNKEIDTTNSKIKVSNAAEVYTYEICIKDKGGNGTTGFVAESSLSRGDIKKNAGNSCS